MNLKKGNLVKVLAGKDKNKSGEIIEIINRLNKAKVKGINIVKNKKKYHAHDEKNMFKIGDIVQIEESKPYSKYKSFKVLEESRWSKSKQNYL